MEAEREKPRVFYVLSPLGVIIAVAISVIFAIAYSLFDSGFYQHIFWALPPVVFLSWLLGNVKYINDPNGLKITVGPIIYLNVGHKSFTIPKHDLLGFHTFTLETDEETGLFFKIGTGDIRYILLPFSTKQMHKFRIAFESTNPDAIIATEDRSTLFHRTFGRKIGGIVGKNRLKPFLLRVIPLFLIVVAIMLTAFISKAAEYVGVSFIDVILSINLDFTSKYTWLIILYIVTLFLCILLPFRRLLSGKSETTLYEEGLVDFSREAPPLIIKWGGISSMKHTRFNPGINIIYTDLSKKKRRLFIQGYFDDSDFQKIQEQVDMHHQG